MISFRTSPRQGQETRHSLAPGRYHVGSGTSDGLSMAGLPPAALELDVASDAVLAVPRCAGFRLSGTPFPANERRLLRPGERLEFGEAALQVETAPVAPLDCTASLARGLLAGALHSAVDSPIPTLLWLNGPDCGKRMPILDEAVFIGRGEGAAARVRDGLASRIHAKLVVKNGAASIVDLDSANGLQVDGKQVERERALRGGEVLRIGETELSFEACLPPPSEPPASAPNPPAPAPSPARCPEGARPPVTASRRPCTASRPPLALLELAAIAGAASVAAGSLATVWLLLH